MGRSGALHYAAAIALAIGPTAVHSKTYVLTTLTGGELASLCEAENGMLAADPCNMYIWGVADGLSAGGLICPRTGSWTAISARFVRKAIKDNPTRWSGPAVKLVADTLRSEYRCKK